MQALVTRPREDAIRTAELLRQRNFAVIVEPLMQMVFTPEALPDLTGIQGILATSANGIRALAQATPRRDLPIWAVGDATGRSAAEFGFTRVRSAGGDVETLAGLVMQNVSAGDGPLLHVAGTEIAGDLNGALMQHGYRVSRVMLYHSRHASALTAETLNALSAGSIDAALFYSPRTAQIFVNLLAQAEIHAILSKSWAFALSAAVAQKLSVLPWAGIHIAEQPTQDHLFRAIDRARFQAD